MNSFSVKATDQLAKCTKSVKYFEEVSSPEVEIWCTKRQQENHEVAIFALVSENDRQQVPLLQNIFNQKSISVIGAIFPALIVGGEFKANGVLLIALDKKPYSFLLAYIPTNTTEIEHFINSIVKDLLPLTEDIEDSALLLIFDAMVPNIATVLDELYVELGDSVKYMGVNAGSETFQPMPCLFDNKKLIQNGMLGIMFPHHEGAVLEHGYKVPDDTIMATSTTGNRILSIDWKPAFEVYQDKIKQQYGVEITKDNFYEYAVHFPFGILRADNEILVRIPVMLNEDNSLFCVGEIPENSILTLLDAPSATSLHTVENLLRKIKIHAINYLFYCAGRRLHLKDGADKELRELQQNMGQGVNIGALSLGEIGSSRKGGYPLFHNATLVSFPFN